MNRCNKYGLMKKKDLYAVCGIIVSGITIAFIINMLLTYGNIIKTNLSNDSWLNFWGSYSSGIFAVVVGYLAIIYSNRNNEKAILQQEKLLIRQQNIKKLDEYNNCLKNNLALLNIGIFSKCPQNKMAYEMIMVYHLHMPFFIVIFPCILT